MPNPSPPQSSAEKNAQKHFKKAEQRDSSSNKTFKTARALDVAKTAKLRGLRLAKEAADKDEADKLAAEKTANGEVAPRARRKTPKVKRVAMVRMIY
jgi:hypothetical protein